MLIKYAFYALLGFATFLVVANTFDFVRMIAGDPENREYARNSLIALAAFQTLLVVAYFFVRRQPDDYLQSNLLALFHFSLNHWKWLAFMCGASAVGLLSIGIVPGAALIWAFEKISTLLNSHLPMTMQIQSLAQKMGEGLWPASVFISISWAWLWCGLAYALNRFSVFQSITTALTVSGVTWLLALFLILLKKANS